MTIRRQSDRPSRGRGRPQRRRHARRCSTPVLGTLLLAGAAALATGFTGSPAHGHETPTRARAAIHDRTGANLGTVELAATPNGVRLHARLHGVPAGVHGFHLHATGRCEGDFRSAGGHFNPTDAAHGFTVADGPHQGDMPNIHVDADGLLEVEAFLPGVRLAGTHGLLDEDGAALVIHEGADDYASQPSGAAGPRIACGVIEPAG